MNIKNIKVYDYYSRFLPLVDAHTIDNLKEQIKSEGILNPLTIWLKDGENILLDGHNRLAIAKELNIDDVPVTVKEFTTDQDAEYWIICNQLNRRNLTERELKYFIGAKYNHEKQDAHAGINQHTKEVDANFAPTKTAEKIAEAYGISERSVHDYANDAKVIEVLPEPTRKNFLSGGDAITTKEIRSLSSAIKKDKKVLDKIKTKEDTQGVRKLLKTFEKDTDVLIQKPPVKKVDKDDIMVAIEKLCFNIKMYGKSHGEKEKESIVIIAIKKLNDL